jgi:hypothetical protein
MNEEINIELVSVKSVKGTETQSISYRKAVMSSDYAKAIAEFVRRWAEDNAISDAFLLRSWLWEENPTLIMQDGRLVVKK